LIVDEEWLHLRADGVYVNMDRLLDFFNFFLFDSSILFYIQSMRLGTVAHTIMREKNLHMSV
jgi:hypothetical protein